MQTMLNYEDFCRTVAGKVCSHLPSGVLANPKDITKNNDTVLKGLVFSDPGTNISPTIYLESFYEEFEKGRDISDITSHIVRLYNSTRVKEDIDMGFFMDFNIARNHICYKLINHASNEKSLKNIPHIPFLDLSIVFICHMDISDDQNGSILISNEHMKMWKADTRTLYRSALLNTPRLLPAQITEMGELIRSLAAEENAAPSPAFPMYIMSNNSRILGATAILYPDALKKAAQMLSDDLYIIPSSIHEVILVPYKDSPEPDELNKIIGEVNKTAVEDSEYLSDHCYYYSQKDDQIFCEKP